jgi:hypothetical protein
LKKKERPSETRTRIEKLNAYYSYAQQVAEAAANIYRNNARMLNQFHLALRHSKAKTKSTIALSAGAVRKITMPKAQAKTIIKLSNNGPLPLTYWQADGKRKRPDPKEQLAALQSIEVAPSTPPLKFLFVQNNSGQPIKVVVKKEE